MSEFSRREFLKALGISLLISTNANSLNTWAAGAEPPFRSLVIGDSLIWGQGLEEKDKTYTIVSDWLRDEAFSGREVDLKVKAHSGATIRFDPKEAEAYRRAGRDEGYYYQGEVNVSFPSMWKQVEMAAAEYEAAGAEQGADLVMLTAGITDITVEGVLDPFGKEKKLREMIRTVCRDRVGELLEHIASHNPNSLIAVIGYFPMISPHSSGSKVLNGWLETLGFPGFLQPLANNPVVRTLFFKRILNNGIERSRIWNEESDHNLQLAVEKLNASAGRQQAIFIKTPLTEQQAVESPETVLFRARGNGSVTDPLYEQRKVNCKTSLDELKRSTGIDYGVKRCAMAGVGHPDITGSRLYAEAIIESLKSVL
ncbi:MAG: hypothetical protein WBO10_09210 [Pyrinomonadaceae bacterium]